MSDIPARRDSGLWLWWNNLPQIAAAVGLVLIIWGLFTYLFGGFQPQSRIDQISMQDRLTKLEAAQTLAAQTAASDRAAMSVAIEAAKQIFSSKMDTMPRPKEFSDWEGHLSKLDGRADGFDHRISEAEYGLRDLANKYGALTTTAPSRPR